MKFVASVYRKPTFSDVLIYFESFVPDMYKCSLIGTLRFYSIEDFHRES